MNMLRQLRRYFFWGQDFFNGSPIRKHYRDLSNIIENYGTPSSQNARKEHLAKLLEHAVESTPFYREMVTSAEFENFPVINKAIILENYEAFKSSRFISKKNVQVATNGSTGIPFRLFHDKNKRYRHSADNLYYARKGGYELGDRLYLFRAVHKKDWSSLMRFFKQNFRAYGILNYSDRDIEKLLYDLKNDPVQKSIVCFASMCDIIVNYIDSNNLQPSDHAIKSIVTDGDALSKSTKDTMESFFKVPVYARYGNMECGVLGQQDDSNTYGYGLNWGSYHFEVLDLIEDKPAKPGEMGRIVVTDLFNYCMPLIRYDTGDLASLPENQNLSTAPVFERIEGRKVDLIYDTRGRVVSPYTVYTKMDEYAGLKQFQFAQKGPKEYVFRLNPWGTFASEQELISDSKGYLGQDAIIQVEYVEEVPLLSSGKRKPVINEM